jgi:hypothetical protein
MPFPVELSAIGCATIAVVGGFLLQASNSSIVRGTLHFGLQLQLLVVLRSGQDGTLGI